MTIHRGWTAHFPTTGRRFWAGDTDLVFDGNTYEAGAGIELSPVQNQLGSPARRAQASFRVSDETLRAALLQDIGPEPVTIEWLQSLDGGISWSRLPIQFVGRVSKPNMNIESGLFTCELETYTGSVDKGLPQKWSHEAQMQRRPGIVDRFFEMASQIEAGTERTVAWPP